MASENIKERKIYRVLIDELNKVWERIYFLTNARSVDADDGDNLETKVGAIKGITTSTTVTEEGWAADAKTVNERIIDIKDKIDTGEYPFYIDYKDGKYGYNTDPNRGADTFVPFKNGPKIGENIIYLGSGTSFNVSTYEGYQEFTASKNFIISNPYGKGTAWVKWASGNRTYELQAQVWSNPVPSYNENTGVLTITCNTYKKEQIGEYNGLDALSADVTIAAPQVWLII